MVRFQPDSWLEWLLRPFVMMDPKVGIYFEEAAPDLRFALVIGFLVLAGLSRRARHGMGFEQRKLLLATFLLLYAWTFAVGNGRYFMAGLVLIGPLLVFSWQRLPGTASFRYAVLAIVLVLQGAVVASTYSAGAWGLVRWVHGAAIDLPESPVRAQPAVFITTTTISYSALVPKFHPASRWSNVVGQQNIVPGMREYEPLVRLLSSPLPKYTIMPMADAHALDNLQPAPLARQSYDRMLLPYGLALTDAACFVLRSDIAPGPPDASLARGRLRGFWVCPLSYSDVARRSVTATPSIPARIAQALGKIEQRCPRFFPPGGNDRIAEDWVNRHYASAVGLVVDSKENIYLKYYRAINPPA